MLLFFFAVLLLVVADPQGRFLMCIWEEPVGGPQPTRRAAVRVGIAAVDCCTSHVVHDSFVDSALRSGSCGSAVQCSATVPL